MTMQQNALIFQQLEDTFRDMMWVMWIMGAFSPRSLPCAVALWHCQCGILRARTFNCLSTCLSLWQILQQWIGSKFCRCPANLIRVIPATHIHYLTTSHVFTEKLCMASCHAFHACRIPSMCPSLWTGKPPSVKCWVLFSEFLGNPHCKLIKLHPYHRSWSISFLCTGIFSFDSDSPNLNKAADICGHLWTFWQLWQLQVSRYEFWKRQRFITWCAGDSRGQRDADALWICDDLWIERRFLHVDWAYQAFFCGAGDLLDPVDVDQRRSRHIKTYQDLSSFGTGGSLVQRFCLLPGTAHEVWGPKLFPRSSHVSRLQVFGPLAATWIWSSAEPTSPPMSLSWLHWEYWFE